MCTFKYLVPQIENPPSDIKEQRLVRLKVHLALDPGLKDCQECKVLIRKGTKILF